MYIAVPPGQKSVASQGVFADGAIAAAQFLGFRGNTGLALYNGVSLAANIYGVFGLMRKPDAWRLFHYVPQDYYRKVSSMSRPMLTMKILLVSNTINHLAKWIVICRKLVNDLTTAMNRQRK